MKTTLERQTAVEQFLSNQTDEEWLRLRNVILEDMPVRIIVTIRAGNFQGSVATGPLILDILDYDNWEACGEDHQDEAAYYAELEAEVEKLKNDPNPTLI